jgi:hypothetical protein
MNVSTRLFFCVYVFTSFVYFVDKKREITSSSAFDTNMDYMTGMTNSPVYEFPYSGAHTSSIPFLNYNPNAFSSVSMITFVDSSKEMVFFVE